jgi:hypothetical protein
VPKIFLNDSRFNAELLEQFDFDTALWLTQAIAVRKRQVEGTESYLKDAFETISEIPEIRFDDSVDERHARRTGEEVLSRGEVAALVLNRGLYHARALVEVSKCLELQRQ